MDAVINLASMAEAACAADPEGALRTNAGGTLALMRAATSRGVSRFVQLSTSKVYGNNPSGTISEGTVPRPKSDYSITHRAAEDYALLHPHPVVLRLANGFGAPVDPRTPCWGIIVNDFCLQAVTTRRISISSDGMAWRNFVPLDDVVTALEAAAAMLPTGIFNLGAAESMTIRNMAERVATVCQTELGYAVGVSVGESRSGAPPEPLVYRTSRLRDAGVLVEGCLDAEIARTLVAAQVAGNEAQHV
jgi:UDP-glucose 4-epimerase